MPISVTLPTLGRPKTVRDAVISILASDWPLTVKMIYNKVRKSYNLSVSYQAVHKVTQEMIIDGVVLKKDRDLTINPEWIRNTKDYYSRLETSIENKRFPTNEEIIKNGVTKLEFESLYDYYMMILDLFRHIAEMHPVTKETDGPFSAQLYHMYWILALSKKEEENIRYIVKHSPNSFFTCRGDTVLDRLLAKYFISLGAKVKTGAECADMCDIFAGGVVTQTFFTPDLKRDLDDLYNKFGNVSDIDIKQLYDQIYNKKTRIHVIVTLNYELEKQIYEQTKKLFSNG